MFRYIRGYTPQRLEGGGGGAMQLPVLTSSPSACDVVKAPPSIVLASMKTVAEEAEKAM